MRRSVLLASPVVMLFVVLHACASSDDGSSAGTPGGAGGAGASGTAAGGDGGGLNVDDAGADSPFDPDAACATALAEAQTEQLPVDIIWMVDNSSSMAPAVAEVKAGLNSFANLIAGKQLDYRVIMLALRNKNSPISVNGGTRYPVCIPPPLAGDDQCGNGQRFFHASVDVLSTQPLEQFLGTLGQTTGYMQGDSRGGEPWLQYLRPQATKTIVVVTDDNARLSKAQFETFAGGTNPFNSSVTLPPGILNPTWNGMFNGYVFDALYGWGSTSDPGAKCVYPDMTTPPSSGPTYTDLVLGTGGVRAKICDGQSAWAPFFDAVSQAVLATSVLSCELDIPMPAGQTIDYNKVNVQITSPNGDVTLVNVDGAAQCGVDGGWYYDDPQSPQKVILCPASCDAAQASVGPGKDGHIQVLFGCDTIVK